ncbi:hypothetical protein, partial [[Clostridium] innocuum]|uniref:hypothetical protein n=1 Tax=Clostridium innocuum TaxID=1522 RepID=UPI0005D2910C
KEEEEKEETKEKEEKGEESEPEAQEPAKKKGKAYITRTPKPPSAVFTKRKVRGKEEKEVVFKRPPPTLQDKIKAIREGAGIANLKS